jgi:hypothetical protein
MIKPFKLLNGYTYSDEYTIPNLDHPIWRDNPPFNLSHRHWNMLPQDLRGATLQEMECYINGWEDARNNAEANPYHDRTRRNLWNRGFLRWRGRIEMNYRSVNPDPPIDETYPEYYNTDEFVFFDITQVMTDPDSVQPYKFMLFRHIEDGYTVDGQRIYSNHPMWNFPDII